MFVYAICSLGLRANVAKLVGHKPPKSAATGGLLEQWTAMAEGKGAKAR